MDWTENELYRYPEEGMVGGVCLGLARYLRIDVAIVRAVFAALLVFSGVGLVLYLALLILVPQERDSLPPCAMGNTADIESADDMESTDDEFDLSVDDLSQNPLTS